MNDKSLIFRGGCRLENIGSSNVSRIPTFAFSELSVTLLTRDYKGLGNYAGNGVMEIYKLSEEQVKEFICKK